MKRSKKLGTLLLIALAATGCVKYDGRMSIRKDKSMDYSFIYALDSSMTGDKTDNFTDGFEELKKMEEKGYKVTEYDKDGYKGIKIEKKFKNIDDISSTVDEKSEEPEIEYSLSNPMEEKSEEKIFTIKKGFLKNKYIAKFNFNTSDAGFDDDADDSQDSDTPFDDIDDMPNGDDFNTDADEENSSIGDLSQMESLMKSLDLKFKISLPRKALSHNATDSNELETELTWDLAKGNVEKIEFEFELYNLTNIYIAGGIILFLFIILFIISNKKGPKEAMANNPSPNMYNPIEENTNIDQASNTFVPNDIPLNPQPMKEQVDLDQNSVENNVGTVEASNNTQNTFITQSYTPNTPIENPINDANNSQNAFIEPTLENAEPTVQPAQVSPIIDTPTQESEPKINPFNI